MGFRAVCETAPSRPSSPVPALIALPALFQVTGRRQPTPVEVNGKKTASSCIKEKWHCSSEHHFIAINLTATQAQGYSSAARPDSRLILKSAGCRTAGYQQRP
ncbi:hypothetical protein [Sodalis glossinidius]|uniref:hypothetical protein n=1 Tax=Sodalis glossinidius TaxID=63612 RepID=UPI0011D10250|nr:hypothetical protein [Sodalis glossinidius]